MGDGGQDSDHRLVRPFKRVSIRQHWPRSCLLLVLHSSQAPEISSENPSERLLSPQSPPQPTDRPPAGEREGGAALLSLSGHRDRALSQLEPSDVTDAGLVTSQQAAAQLSAARLWSRPPLIDLAPEVRSQTGSESSPTQLQSAGKWHAP